MSRVDEIVRTLSQEFDKKKIKSAVAHYLNSVKSFSEGEWEYSLIKSGKFIEAVLKILLLRCGEKLPQPRKIKVGNITKKIENAGVGKIPDEIRLQIPRASVFVYDISSNRGARHDPGEVDPNEMDAIVVTSVCSWILAELLRFSAKGVLSIENAKQQIDSLIERVYPIFESIEDRIYIEKSKYTGALECALLILYFLDTSRISPECLKDMIVINGFNRTALKFNRLKPYIDIDESGNIMIRASGRKMVEKIFSKNK